MRRVEQLTNDESQKFPATGRMAATIAYEVNRPMQTIMNTICFLPGARPENARLSRHILKPAKESVAGVRAMRGLNRRLPVTSRESTGTEFKIHVPVVNA